MRRVSLAAVASATILAAVAWGHAATPMEPPLPKDPALALAALDRKIADLDASEQADKAEIERVGSQVGGARARVLARGGHSTSSRARDCSRSAAASTPW